MMERERLRIAQDIHDDLGARVTQISLFSAMAQGNPALPEKARSDFERIPATVSNWSRRFMKRSGRSTPITITSRPWEITFAKWPAGFAKPRN